MDTHVRALGIMNIVFGVLSAIFVIATLSLGGGVSELFVAAQADFTVAALFASMMFHAVVGVPCIVLGFAVMRYSDPARSLLTAISALNLLNVPIGPIIGGYGLWVLLTPETDPLFSEPPRRAGQQKRPAAAERDADNTQVVKGTSVLRSRGADAGPQ